MPGKQNENTVRMGYHGLPRLAFINWGSGTHMKHIGLHWVGCSSGCRSIVESYCGHCSSPVLHGSRILQRDRARMDDILQVDSHKFVDNNLEDGRSPIAMLFCAKGTFPSLFTPLRRCKQFHQ